MTYTKYTREVLEDAVINSTSVAGVLRYLGLKQAGGTQAHIKSKIVNYGISTAHFYNPGFRGKSRNKKTPNQILVKGGYKRF